MSEQETSKACCNSKCTQVNPQTLAKFFKRASAKDGLDSQCSACHSLYYRVYRTLNKKKIQDRQVMSNYGLDGAAYARMAAQQDFRCAICRNPETRVRGGNLLRLAVDHCHRTGTVRGLLCNNCNRGLGLLKDNIALLMRAVAYLVKGGYSEY